MCYFWGHISCNQDDWQPYFVIDLATGICCDSWVYVSFQDWQAMEKVASPPRPAHPVAAGGYDSAHGLSCRLTSLLPLLHSITMLSSDQPNTGFASDTLSSPIKTEKLDKLSSHCGWQCLHKGSLFCKGLVQTHWLFWKIFFSTKIIDSLIYIYL
jgi:hypothetical protein